MERRITIVIGSALLVQVFVRYWGQAEESLRWGMFYWSTAVARTAVPLIVCFALAISPSKLGLGKPRLPPREGRWILGFIAAAVVVALPILGTRSYQDAYAYQALGWGYGRPGRWLSWVAFTASTTLSWELFYRSFLLFGLREILRSGGCDGAGTLAVLFTACFEVLSHLVKPPLESLAMVVGSPALSWVALRHGSVWIPLALHVYIEFLWFMSVWR